MAFPTRKPNQGRGLPVVDLAVGNDIRVQRTQQMLERLLLVWCHVWFFRWDRVLIFVYAAGEA